MNIGVIRMNIIQPLRYKQVHVKGISEFQCEVYVMVDAYVARKEKKKKPVKSQVE